MKKKLKFGFMIMFTLTLFSTTCSSDDEGIYDNSAEIQEVVNLAQSGTWIVTYFFDTDSDETSDFAGYQFSFDSDGILAATNGSSTITGTWSVTNDSSSSNSRTDDDDIDFNISFSSPADFEELSDDWDIISTSTNKIELIDVSGGNGGTDYLTFEKQ